MAGSPESFIVLNPGRRTFRYTRSLTISDFGGPSPRPGELDIGSDDCASGERSLEVLERVVLTAGSLSDLSHGLIGLSGVPVLRREGFDGQLVELKCFGLISERVKDRGCE